MKRTASPSWIDPAGAIYPLHGKGHSEFAYDILLNEKLGDYMSKKIPTDGSSEQKGKSGEVAKADAASELGDPQDPRHSAVLCERGWVQASDNGQTMIVRAIGLDRLRSAWPHIVKIGSTCEAVVFAVGRPGSGVSAGLCGKDLLSPAESVLGRIAEAATVKAGGRPGPSWPQGHGIKYFE